MERAKEEETERETTGSLEMVRRPEGEETKGKYRDFCVSLYLFPKRNKRETGSNPRRNVREGMHICMDGRICGQIFGNIFGYRLFVRFAHPGLPCIMPFSLIRFHYPITWR